MLIKISWRNIWRNPQRSVIMIVAIATGLWGGMFAAAIFQGLSDQRFRTGIEQEFSHVQVHHPEFLAEQNSRYTVGEKNEIYSVLSQHPEVIAFSGRSIVFGMIATANQTKGIKILGVDPAMEAATTLLQDNIIEGDFLDVGGRNPVIIGKTLADKMKARVGSRVVITFQDLNNELVSVACRVAGIFQTANSSFDESNIFLPQKDLNAMLGSQEMVNEIAIVLQDHRLSDEFAATLGDSFAGLTVRSWAEISPEMGFLNEMGLTMFMIILFIIMLALAFGLLNTMIMSVFERVRELGMLMSIGMNKKRVFLMILLETVFLTITGAVCGMIAGTSTIALFARRGIDLTAVGGDSLNAYGFEAIVYPNIEHQVFAMLTIMVVLTALFTGIYPALKAIRLKPAEAVRAE